MDEENEDYEYIEEYIESFGITFDSDSWNEDTIQHLSKYIETHEGLSMYNVGVVPEGVVDYLAPVVEGYMVGPTAVFKNQTLTAKSRMVEDIKEFKDYVSELDKPVFLYMVTYIPSHPVFKALDNDLKPVELDRPEIKGGYWTIRYSVLGEM